MCNIKSLYDYSCYIDNDYHHHHHHHQFISGARPTAEINPQSADVYLKITEFLSIHLQIEDLIHY